MEWATDEMERVAQIEAAASGTQDPAAMAARLVRMVEDEDEDLEWSDVHLASVRASITFEERWDEPEGRKWAQASVVLAAVERRAFGAGPLL
jgi:hypothetical protein